MDNRNVELNNKESTDYSKEYYKEHKDIWAKKYYGENREKKLKYQKEYSRINKGGIKKYKARYRQGNIDKIKKLEKEYRQKNKERIKKYKREYYIKNLERIKKHNKDNEKRIKESKKIYRKKPKVKKQMKEYKIICNLRGRFRYVLKHFTQTGKIMSSKEYGISYETIIEHLKPLPKNLSDYHIHHIKPLFTFDFINSDGSTNLEEVRKAFAPENHKLMLIEEHRKLNHFEPEF